MSKIKLVKHKGHLVPEKVTFLVSDIEKLSGIENVSYEGYFTKGHPERATMDFRGYDEVHRNLILRINQKEYTAIISIRTSPGNLKDIIKFVNDYRFN